MAMNRESRFAFFGSKGEQVFLEWAKRKGLYIVPAYLIERGGAPLLESNLRQYVLPDVLASRGGLSKWVEIKCKAECTKYGVTKAFQTGCFVRNWDDYVAVQEATGIPGWLAFQHATDSRIYMQSLDFLAKHISHTDYGGGPTNALTHYWDVDFFYWIELQDSSLVREFKGCAIPRVSVKPWENPSSKGPDFKQHRLGLEGPDS